MASAGIRSALSLVVCLLMSLMLSGCHVDKVADQLYRGPDPGDKLLKQLHSMGIKSIISCRLHPQPKKAKRAEALGMKWYQIPTGVFLTPGDPEINKFFEIVADPKNQPAYICCEIGVDRVGLYSALYKIVKCDYTYDDALDDAHKHGLKRWWYVFRDYKRVMQNYYTACVDKKASPQNAEASDAGEETAAAGGAATAAVMGVQRLPERQQTGGAHSIQ